MTDELRDLERISEGLKELDASTRKKLFDLIEKEELEQEAKRQSLLASESEPSFEELQELYDKFIELKELARDEDDERIHRKAEAALSKKERDYIIHYVEKFKDTMKARNIDCKVKIRESYDRGVFGKTIVDITIENHHGDDFIINSPYETLQKIFRDAKITCEIEKTIGYAIFNSIERYITLYVNLPFS